MYVHRQRKPVAGLPPIVKARLSHPLNYRILLRILYILHIRAIFKPQWKPLDAFVDLLNALDTFALVNEPCPALHPRSDLRLLEALQTPAQHARHAVVPGGGQGPPALEPLLDDPLYIGRAGFKVRLLNLDVRQRRLDARGEVGRVLGLGFEFGEQGHPVRGVLKVELDEPRLGGLLDVGPDVVRIEQRADALEGDDFTVAIRVVAHAFDRVVEQNAPLVGCCMAMAVSMRCVVSSRSRPDSCHPVRGEPRDRGGAAYVRFPPEPRVSFGRVLSGGLLFLILGGRVLLLLLLLLLALLAPELLLPVQKVAAEEQRVLLVVAPAQREKLLIGAPAVHCAVASGLGIVRLERNAAHEPRERRSLLQLLRRRERTHEPAAEHRLPFEVGGQDRHVAGYVAVVAVGVAAQLFQPAPAVFVELGRLPP
mmetsp:Transcript_25927/g.46063  ORF Transcript_25927/g.46063 Transcript_25927/m.46063 type:complete len:423 (-) Transcript_25927:772-2040(-)